MSGEVGHRGAVLADRVKHDPFLVLPGKAVVARRDQHAGGESLDIPLPRTGQRLIKIVDIEHQAPLGRGEHPEVRQVRIPAALHCQPRPRRRGEVIGHEQRRPAIERERRDQHPPVADRHELRYPRLRLTLQQRDRISATRRRLELRVIRARHLTPRRLTTRNPLSHRQMPSGRGLRLLARRGCPAARSGRPCTWSCGRHGRSFRSIVIAQSALSSATDISNWCRIRLCRRARQCIGQKG